MGAMLIGLAKGENDGCYVDGAHFVRTLEGNKVDGCFDSKMVGSAVAEDDEKNGSAEIVLLVGWNEG
jgi:hypothetical protein